ncbi:hypothetical protein D3C71_1048040 [compost metagenome]
MDETPLSHIDASMTDLGTAIGGKEKQVAGLQAVLAHIRRLHGDHLARGTRQGNTGDIAVHISDQAAAIKSGIRRIATPAIRRAHQTERAKQHVFRFGRKSL